MKKQMITFFVLIATAMTMNAQKTVAGVKVDEKLTIENQNLVLNGVGTRVKLFMDMYVGALYLEKKSTNANDIMASKDGAAIRLTIVSGLISSDKMVDAVTEGFENSTGGKTAPLKSKIDKFIGFFKDEIKKGDVFTMINTES
nr:chalcone isomerase family protein [Flavobacterium sp.]